MKAFFFSPRHGAAVAAVLTLVVLLPIWWQASRSYQARLLAEERAIVNAHLDPLEGALTSALHRRLALLEGLKVFVQVDMSEARLRDRFETFAAGLYSSARGIRHLVVAPGGVSRYVYPLAGTELLSGRDQLRDPRPNMVADVERAIASRRVTLSGPHEVSQGGLGLDVRQAVYRDGAFWGLVSMALDVPSMLDEAGLERHRAGLDLAVRNGSGVVFYGPITLFGAEPAVHRILLPEGFWELAGVPSGGWHRAIRERLVLFHAGALVIVALVASLVYLVANRQLRLAHAVAERTREISDVNEALQQDIAERQRVEEALRDSETRLRSVVDTAVDGIITIDEEGTVQIMNPAAERMFGYPTDEVVGRNVMVLMPPPYREAHDDYLASYRRTGVPKIIGIGREVVGRRKDGSTFPMELAVSEVRVGSRREFVGIVRDVSRRKALEGAARQAEKLAALGTLAAGLAHELNNPIGVISSRVELMIEDAQREVLPSQARADLGVVQSHIQRMSRIVKALLSFARRGPGQKIPVSLNSVVEDTMVFMARQIEKEGIAVRVELAPELPPVLGDPTLFGQVLLNLVTNAREVLDGSGEITVRTERDPACPARVRLVVRDTGPGIPEEHLLRIFEPFFTTKSGGTGLGLAISYGIVHDHGGTIDVESGRGTGTTFVLSFPAL